MEVALDVGNWPGDGSGDGNTVVTNSSRAAEQFLAEFPFARIVVVIDTHCSESGFFLWRGDPKGDFNTSPLLLVSNNTLSPSFSALRSSRS